MGQSHPTVRTTDQSKARRLEGGTEFFSTHKLTACAACPGNLAALKLPNPIAEALLQLQNTSSNDKATLLDHSHMSSVSIYNA